MQKQYLSSYLSEVKISEIKVVTNFVLPWYLSAVPAEISAVPAESRNTPPLSWSWLVPRLCRKIYNLSLH